MVYFILNRITVKKKEKKSLPWSEIHLNTLIFKQALNGRGVVSQLVKACGGYACSRRCMGPKSIGLATMVIAG
jgi:hypothetical protein